MRVLYDHQIFTNQKFGGISRYFFELIKRFEGVENSCDVASLFSNNAYYNKDINIQAIEYIGEWSDDSKHGQGTLSKTGCRALCIEHIVSGYLTSEHCTT